jgi:hypothetical protein
MARGKKSKITATRMCDRCDRPAENPTEACVHYGGADLKDAVICLPCQQLSRDDPPLFWHYGWLRHGGKRSVTG